MTGSTTSPVGRSGVDLGISKRRSITASRFFSFNGERAGVLTRDWLRSGNNLRYKKAFHPVGGALAKLHLHIFLDFDNVFSSLFSKSSGAAVEFAESPALWLGALQGMKGSEVEDTNHNFVIRRCYMNPAGRVPGSKPFSVFRQSFVRDGWEVIDTPPLTNQGKTSADTHIVMDVLDAVAHFPHVSEYVILAADADYTPLIIRLRKYMKTTVIYAPAAMSVAYRAACDSVIEEQEMLNLLEADEEPEAVPAQQPVIVGGVTPEKIKHTVDRYFSESRAWSQSERRNPWQLTHQAISRN